MSAGTPWDLALRPEGKIHELKIGLEMD